MVDLVPNREKYEDVYPEDSEDEDSDEFEDDANDSENENAIIKALKQEKKDNEDATKKASEARASASSRLAMLENYARSLEKDRPNDLENCVSTYSEERKKAFDAHFASDAEIKALEKERIKIAKKHTKALHAISKEKKKATKEKAKKIEKKQRAQREKQEAKARLKQDRIEFWPRKVYRVNLSLDTNSDMTPASSRRGSVDSLAKTLSETSMGHCQISLSLSYITDSAWWSPRYDLSLDTPTSSGLIIYRAEFCNATSETWKDSKVILSTSETNFSGIGEPIPTLQPWHIRLIKRDGFAAHSDSTSGALVSNYEMQQKQRNQLFSANKVGESRNTLFGLGNSHVSQPLFGMQQKGGFQVPQQAPQQQAPNASAFGQPSRTGGGLFGNSNQPAPPPPQAAGGGLFGSVRTGETFFGNSNQAAPPAAGGGLFGGPPPGTGFAGTNNTGGSLFGNITQNRSDAPPLFSLGRPQAQADEVDYSDEEQATTTATIIPDLPSLSTQESEWAETGMTATYDIPSTRTVSPAHTLRRHKIASITLKDINLSHFLIPKLRAAAFLKARIRNTSSITLLKGPTGLTLDGSFLGNATLPRCSANESFNLSLGIDPSVSVTYSKPVVKRSQTGVFQKEGSGIYTRVCTITNNKSNRAIEGTVLDQIPVSEDERLKVDILHPSGLRSEGDSAKTGAGVAAAGKEEKKWGTAKAVLKKAGEVSWTVNVEPSRGVKLTLEYEARFPSNEVVVGC